MLDVYTKMANEYLAMPVIRGRKTEAERFPGAVDTTCIEAMMQDRKALQAGTSHFLGQNFARAADIRFQSAAGGEEYVWTTSWGASTRLIGGLIMTHGDDDGLILPPRVASSHLVLMPIIRKDSDKETVMTYTQNLARALVDINYHGRPLRVEVDTRDTGGARNWDWIKKGIPLRLEIGPRDIAADSVFMARRDKPLTEKTAVKREAFLKTVGSILDEIQAALFQRAQRYTEENTRNIDDKEEFYQFFTPENQERPEIHGGFAVSPWCGSPDCEARIKADLAVTVRCVPFEAEEKEGRCICCGEKSTGSVVFAKSY